MKRSLRILLAAVVASSVASSAACTREEIDPVTPGQSAVENANVTAERVGNGVKITNGSTARISYVVLNPNWLGLLASCRTAECPTIAAGASVVVPESAIHGFSSSAAKLVVRYWPETTSVFDPIEIEVAM